jgi:Amt family ammonium transporter
VIGFVLLTPAAAAGIALINAGLGRSRNVAHTLLSSLCSIALASLAYFAIGFAWQGYPGGPAHVLNVAGKTWSWIGAGQFLLRGVPFDGAPFSLAAVLGMFGAAMAAIIPPGAAAERWRLGASCASTALLAGLTYPVFAHWTWGGGWLAQLGANYHLGRGFIDCSGSGAIQAVGGLTALSVAWILGPRRGKYPPDGMPAAIPAHSTAFVLFGCFLAWFGWLGLNCSAATLFSGVVASRGTLIAVNTTLAASAALAAAGLITGMRFGKTDASLCANGFVAGLVASSAGCAVMRPAGAVLVGMVAGALAVFSVEWLETHGRVDDPGGAISVHAVGGVWGVLAVALVAQIDEPGQWVAQLVGVATLLGFVLPVSYGLNWLLDRFRRQRAAPEAERQGLDLYELGSSAYPDFVSHKDEY